MEDSVFISHVRLRNYKSIARCSVELGPCSFLVGPNGAGKSNFLDSLRLVSEALHTSLEHALRERGGIGEVRRRSAGHPTHFELELTCNLPGKLTGSYAFRVSALKNGGYQVQDERCSINDDSNTNVAFYRIADGKLVDPAEIVMPPASKDRLYLVSAAGLPAYRPLYDSLSRMGFYSFNPVAIRELQSPDWGEVLRRDGSNLASVLGMMKKEDSDSYQQVETFLSKVVSGIEGVSTKHVGNKETIEFHQNMGFKGPPWRFLAENMSDGTLRALGVLTSLFQTVKNGNRRVPLVGIEEPEIAVHPGAAGILRDAIIAASSTTQVLVTSHSPDLLDDHEINLDSIIGVASTKGETIIGPVDEAGRSVIRERLFTAGELLRQNQLLPDEKAIAKEDADPFEMFPQQER